MVKIEESRTQQMRALAYAEMRALAYAEMREDAEDDESFVNVVGEENLIGYAALETSKDQSDLIIH